MENTVTKKIHFTDEAIDTIHGQVIVFSKIAKDHIEYGHKVPGKGSVFARFDMSLITEALKRLICDPDKRVYEVHVPKVGYDLVLPAHQARQLPNAKRVAVEKEERGNILVVTGYTTTQNIDDFLQDTMSIVVLQTRQVHLLPQGLANDARVLQAVQDGSLYSVVSSWPGRGDVPPASQWGDDWAVVVPLADGD